MIDKKEYEEYTKGNRLCECGKKLQEGYRYTDWHYEQNDTYGTFQECLKIFNNAIKEDPELRCSIYDISYCECGNEFDEGIIFNEKCPEYIE